MIAILLLLVLLASQLFWLSRLVVLAERLLPRRPRRGWLALAVGVPYVLVLVYSFPSVRSCCMGHIFRPADYRLHSVLIEGVFWWWFVGSLPAFALMIAFSTVDHAARATVWVYRRAQGRGRRRAPPGERDAPPSSDRRRFIQQAALLLSATPFAAAGYGLLVGRLDVEIVRRRIRLARLPQSFENFQLAQLSDVHIGPFTTAEYIRRCVAITNGLSPHVIVLTGDYINWDQEAVGDVANALAGLRAPYGVFACLGNHEEEGGTEDITTRLFAAAGIRVLRQERAPIQLRGETLGLAGIDCPRGATIAEFHSDLVRRLGGLALPDTANVLLSHYPNVFERAAEAGFELTLAGHTHGGQLSLDFISPGLNLSRYLYRHTSGWHEKDGAQLYVNRGLGTSGLPIRLGAPPEITLLELGRMS